MNQDLLHMQINYNSSFSEFTLLFTLLEITWRKYKANGQCV